MGKVQSNIEPWLGNVTGKLGIIFVSVGAVQAADTISRGEKTEISGESTEDATTNGAF